MDAIKNILPIQKNINTTYDNAYIKEALANMGQRLGAKGDSITIKSFLISDLFENTEYIRSDYNRNSETILFYDQNGSQLQLQSTNTVNSSNEILLYDSLTFNNILYPKIDSNYVIKLSESSYVSVVKLTSEENQRSIIAVLRFNIINSQINVSDNIILEINGNTIFGYYDNNQYSNTYDSLNATVIYNELILKGSFYNIKNAIKGLVNENQTSISDSILQEISNISGILPKYIIENFDKQLLGTDNDYKNLKYIILQSLAEAISKDNLNRVQSINNVSIYWNKSVEIKYTCSYDNGKIFYGNNILVKYNKDVIEDVQNMFNNDFAKIIVDCSNEFGSSIYMLYDFVVNWNDSYSYDNFKSITCSINTIFPYIGKSSIGNENVWYINGEESEVQSTGNDAGKPNIMMISYDYVKGDSTVIGSEDYISATVLFAFDINTNAQIIENSINGNNSVEKTFYYSTETAINNSEFETYEFTIPLPNAKQLIENSILDKSYFENSLLLTFIDAKACEKLHEQLFGASSADSTYITVFWRLDVSNNNYEWKPILNQRLLGVTDQDKCPVLDMGSMVGIKDIVKYYVSTEYEPDKYFHNWVVFSEISNAIKNDPEQYDGIITPICPVIKPDGSLYYNNDYVEQDQVYSNELHFVPKFIKRDNIETDATTLGINKIDDFTDTKDFFSVSDGNFTRTIKIEDKDNGKSVYLPNPTKEEGSVAYPIFDFKEVIGNNLTIFNNLSIIGLGNNGKTYLGFIGSDPENEDKSILTIAPTSYNINMLNNKTLTSDYDKFGVFTKLVNRFATVFEKPLLYKYDNYYILVLPINYDDKKLAQYKGTETVETIETPYMKQPTLYTRTFKIGLYLNEKYPDIIDESGKEIIVELDSNVSDEDDEQQSILYGIRLFTIKLIESNGKFSIKETNEIK